MADRLPFLPSLHGFEFTNRWPAQPCVVVRTPFGRIDIGNASAGLCGGMIFAAADYWQQSSRPPTARPAHGDPLYAYLVRRLVDSWYLPTGAMRYYQWMVLPDGSSGLSIGGRRVVVEQGLASRTVQQQWPRVRSELDRGVPVALGIVTVASWKPADLALNHQVLAYGYKIDGRRVRINVYDPNRGASDDVCISFDTQPGDGPTRFDHTLGLPRLVRGFFRTRYDPAAPPPSA